MATIAKPAQRELRDYISETSEPADVRAVSPLPLGTQETGGGVNFSILNRYASRVRLELFDQPEDAVPSRTIDLDSADNHTGGGWHVWVAGIGSGQLYAYRMDGPYKPSDGHRFNFSKLLLDPFATAISQLPPWDFASALGSNPSAPEQDLALSNLNNSGSMLKCVFVNEPFDWKGDPIIAFRCAHPILNKDKFYTDAEIRWFNPQQQSPNWFDPKEKQLACLIQEGEQCALCLMFNASGDGVDFALPPAPSGARWHLTVDTSQEASQGLFAAGDEPLWETRLTYRLSPRSSAVPVARRPKVK